MFEQLKFEIWEDVYSLYQNDDVFRSYAKQQHVIIVEDGFKVYLHQHDINQYVVLLRYRGNFLGYPIFELSVNINRWNKVTKGSDEKLLENIATLLKLFVQLLEKTEYLVVPKMFFTDSSPDRDVIEMYNRFTDRLFAKEDKLKIKTLRKTRQFLREFYWTLNLYLNEPLRYNRFNRLSNAGLFFGEFDEKLVEKFSVMKDNLENSLMKINQKMPFIYYHDYIDLKSRALEDFLKNYYTKTKSVDLYEKLYDCKIDFTFLKSCEFSENDFSFELKDIRGKESFTLTMQTINELEQIWLLQKEEKEIEELMGSYVPKGFIYLMEEVTTDFEIEKKQMEPLFKQFFLANQPVSMAEFEKKLIILKNNIETEYFEYQMKNRTSEMVVKGIYFDLGGTKQILAIVMTKTDSKDTKKIINYDYHFYQGNFEDLKSAPITTLFKEMI